MNKANLLMLLLVVSHAGTAITLSDYLYVRVGENYRKPLTEFVSTNEKYQYRFDAQQPSEINIFNNDFDQTQFATPFSQGNATPFSQGNSQPNQNLSYMLGAQKIVSQLSLLTQQGESSKLVIQVEEGVLAIYNLTELQLFIISTYKIMRILHICYIVMPEFKEFYHID